ncbi:hypothetical protein [Ruegeria arenilitoris]|uniref:hypothetical protein n=1 Tax=Ruegeria arenilitoris TaxID=1173585 RepID=UPI0014818EF7|nr:hypothetical protein [Ruegeria arenilitoris]
MLFSKVVSTVAVATLTFSTPLHALPTATSDRAELFAICSGRLEALATRQRAQMDEQAVSVADLQHEFELLLDAILPRALSEGVEAHQPGRWRVRGWVEVAYLLADMDYSFDERTAAGAERQLARRISECREVLL